MKTTLSLVLFGLIAMLLLAGCPRDTDTGGDTSENPDGRKPDYSQQDEAPADDAAATDAEAVEGDEAIADEAAAAGEEAVEGEEAGEGEEAVEGEEAMAEGEKSAEAEGEEPMIDEEKADSEYPIVVLETTVGEIEFEIRPDWAPIGAEHFLELVNAGYYDGAPFFRVIEGFMAQTGFSGNDELTKKYLGNNIMDEPVLKGCERGTVAFGKSGAPNSRSAHIFINFKDNSPMLSPQGFSAFAHVIKGMDVVEKIYITGENPGGLQGRLAQPGGVASFIKNNPDITVINRAYVKE